VANVGRGRRDRSFGDGSGQEAQNLDATTDTILLTGGTLTFTDTTLTRSRGGGEPAVDRQATTPARCSPISGATGDDVGADDYHGNGANGGGLDNAGTSTLTNVAVTNKYGQR